MKRTARTSTEWLLLAALLVLVGCATTAQPPQSQQSGDAVTAVPAMLQASADAWNRGDLDEFLNDYLDSGETAFVGGSAVRFGVDQIRERYLATYWKTGVPAQQLGFEDIHVRPLGPDHALARGMYVLTNPDGSPGGTGWFSLVLVRTDDGWRIIHDHSSSLP